MMVSGSRLRSLPLAFLWSRVYTYAYDTSTAGTIRGAAARELAINQKSGHLFSSFADCEFAQFIGTDEPSPKEMPLRWD